MDLLAKLWNIIQFCKISKSCFRKSLGLCIIMRKLSLTGTLQGRKMVFDNVVSLGHS